MKCLHEVSLFPKSAGDDGTSVRVPYQSAAQLDKPAVFRSVNQEYHAHVLCICVHPNNVLLYVYMYLVQFMYLIHSIYM